MSVLKFKQNGETKYVIGSSSEGSVRYDEAQSLTDLQKEQARANINACYTEDVLTLEEIEASTDLNGKIASGSAAANLAKGRTYGGFQYINSRGNKTITTKKYSSIQIITAGKSSGMAVYMIQYGNIITLKTAGIITLSKVDDYHFTITSTDDYWQFGVISTCGFAIS